MAAPVSIPALIDRERASVFRWRVLVLCCTIALLDGCVTQAMVFTGPAMLSALRLQANELEPVLTAGIVGMPHGPHAAGFDIAPDVNDAAVSFDGAMVLGASAAGIGAQALAAPLRGAACV